MSGKNSKLKYAFVGILCAFLILSSAAGNFVQEETNEKIKERIAADKSIQRQKKTKAEKKAEKANRAYFDDGIGDEIRTPSGYCRRQSARARNRISEGGC